jgi:excinuclease ABC subunit B
MEERLFKLHAPFRPTGDQPEAVAALAKGLTAGERRLVLQGVTGSGKTFTMANLIAEWNRPTLILSHNKTLAAQLFAELKEFFPENSVEYFISYYDYYQPEAYIPGKDVYIEKDAMINDEIDRLRHSATSSLFERRDVIIVSSVSCIYSLGDPTEYLNQLIGVRRDMDMSREELLYKLVSIGYERNDISLERDKFRVKGDVVEVIPARTAEKAVRIEFFGDTVDRITEVNTLTGEMLRELTYVGIFPATHYAVAEDKREAAFAEIEEELRERSREATISPNCSGVILPLPTSTSVPTTARTIFLKKRLARKIKTIIPHSISTHSARKMWHILLVLLLPSFAKVVKSSLASRCFAASFIASMLSGVVSCQVVWRVKGSLCDWI